MLDFTGADAKRERAECAVRARMAVAANDRHTGLRQAKFRSDDVHDALFARANVEERDAEVGAISSQHLDLFSCDWISNWQSSIGSWHVVIDCGDCQLRTTHGTICCPQAIESLGRGNLVNQVQIDVEKDGFI